jgi:hypothetical protein
MKIAKDAKKGPIETAETEKIHSKATKINPQSAARYSSLTAFWVLSSRPHAAVLLKLGS